MELFLFSCALTGLATIIVSIDEWFDWMGSYDRAGAEDRQYQLSKQHDDFY